MPAAILSAGPSLTKTWHGPLTGVESFAVNRAIMAIDHDPDWFVAGDRHTLQIVGHRRPRIGTYYGATPRDCAGWGQMVYFLDLPGIRELPRPWQWSIQGALAAAVHRGHRLVAVYGVDHAGDTDASETDCPSRTEERWERERADWAMSVEWAKRQGVTVLHVSLDADGRTITKPL